MEVIEQPCEQQYPHEAHQHRHGIAYDGTQPIFWCGGLTQATPTEHMDEEPTLEDAIHEVLVERQVEVAPEPRNDSRTDEKYIRLGWNTDADGQLQFSIELSGKVHEALSVMRFAEHRLIGHVDVQIQKEES